LTGKQIEIIIITPGSVFLIRNTEEKGGLPRGRIRVSKSHSPAEPVFIPSRN